MLARLEMSVDACIDAYQKLAIEIFGEQKPSWLEKIPWYKPVKKALSLGPDGCLYSASTLEKVIQKIVRDTIGDAHSKMRLDVTEKPGVKTELKTKCGA